MPTLSCKDENSSVLQKSTGEPPAEQQKGLTELETGYIPQLTCFPASTELDSPQVNQIHAVQIVVYEELQQVGDVALVGLINLVHHSSTL